MATLEIILQGFEPGDDHESAVNKLLQVPETDEFLFSLAFVRRNGVERLATNLKKVADRVTVYMGIRNGITSVQSVFSLLELGILPFAIDTSASNKIFHPKIYAAIGENTSSVILGSANLTFGGLNQNIEASSAITLDHNDPSDKDYVDKLMRVFQALTTSYPEHVFRISTRRDAVRLLHEGRLEDERVTRLPRTSAPPKSKERDKLKPIPTHVGAKSKPKSGGRKKTVRKTPHAAILRWESKPLTERSLNIPRGTNTNITGDTNLGAGQMTGIDFQTYFRDDVFSGVAWATDSSSASPHLERAEIHAELVIKKISYGVFDLEVTHDPRTNTRSFNQRNVMTKIKWGAARTLVAQRDLIGRTLRLYQQGPVNFVIVID